MLRLFILLSQFVADGDEEVITAAFLRVINTGTGVEIATSLNQIDTKGVVVFDQAIRGNVRLAHCGFPNY